MNAQKRSMIKIFSFISETSQGLPLFAAYDELPLYRKHRELNRFFKCLLLNKSVMAILQRLPQLSVEAWLTSGCLVQTAWNVRQGRPAEAGILDYDLIYYDPDPSWDRENDVIQTVADLFADMPIRMEIRNQARIPLWYNQKYAVDYPAVRQAHHAVLRYPSRTSAIAVTNRNGEYLCYAPFGFRDALSGRVRPNPRLSIKDVYTKKTDRWVEIWPHLQVEPWHD